MSAILTYCTYVSHKVGNHLQPFKDRPLESRPTWEGWIPSLEADLDPPSSLLPVLHPPRPIPEGMGDEFVVEVAVDDDIDALLSSINSWKKIFFIGLVFKVWNKTHPLNSYITRLKMIFSFLYCWRGIYHYLLSN